MDITCKVTLQVSMQANECFCVVVKLQSTVLLQYSRVVDNLLLILQAWIGPADSA